MMALAEEVKTSLDRPQLIRSGAAVEAAQRVSLELLARDDASTLVLQGLYIEMLGEITRAPDDTWSGAPGWLTVACSMLREESLVGLTIQEVAAEVAVHPSHLAKCFRRYIGQSPGEFARNARLERAHQALQHSSKPIKLIAEEVGFADQAHFTRAFKRAFGYAPSAVRRA
jgi:AraC family transcriptional regulator